MSVRRVDYAKFNAALDKLMSVESNGAEVHSIAASAFDGETVESEAQSTNKNTGSSGSISVQVTLANGAVPIEGAKVTVFDSDGKEIESGITDQSGRIKWIELPTPSLEYSQTPGTTIPYYTYNIWIEKTGFYTEEYLNVAVFPGIESIQSVSLEPLGADALENDRVNTTVESGPEISGSDTEEQ